MLNINDCGPSLATCEHALVHPKQLKLIQLLGREPETLNDIGEAIRLKLVENTNDCLWGLHWLLNYNPEVSNSHSAPLSGVENWGGRNDRPLGYPGWTGRVWVRYSRPLHGFAHDYFGDTLSYTGTGGFGPDDGPWERVGRQHHHHQDRARKLFRELWIYSWDYRIFEDDWPRFRDIQDTDRGHARTVAILKGQTVPLQPGHRFRWDNPEAERWDQEFQKWVQTQAALAGRWDDLAQ